MIRRFFLSISGLVILAVAFNDSLADSNRVPTLRIATFNASLHGNAVGDITKRLKDGVDPQAQSIAAIVQTVRPDILLINELDYDKDGQPAQLLNERFFGIAHGPGEPCDYPYVYAIPSNTGVASGMDLNRNGRVDDPEDAWGYGAYPGQYAMAVFSRFPIDRTHIRSFQRLRWATLPAARRPMIPDTGQFYYDDSTWARLRLSSKNHVDVPIQLDDITLHVLVSHPTPPVFDGPEDRNGCRNHDEIQFWNAYLGNDKAGHRPTGAKNDRHWILDDQGSHGQLDPNAWVVVLGDLNSDPADGDSDVSAITRLLDHWRLQDPLPSSEGAVEDRKDDRGDPLRDTAAFGHANMRVDYVLPDHRFRIGQCGVFWPTRRNPQYELIRSSDHRLVWVDVVIPKDEQSSPAQSRAASDDRSPEHEGR